MATLWGACSLMTNFGVCSLTTNFGGMQSHDTFLGVCSLTTIYNDRYRVVTMLQRISFFSLQGVSQYGNTFLGVCSLATNFRGMQSCDTFLGVCSLVTIYNARYRVVRMLQHISFFFFTGSFAV